MASPATTGEKLVNLNQLNILAQAVKNYGDEINANIVDGLKFVAVSNNKLNFYKTTTATGDPAVSVDLPREMFLDATVTTLESNFQWSAAAYPNTTNPNLNGQKVLVLGVKTTEADGTSVSIAYSFVSVQDLVDVLTVANGDSSKVLTVNNNVISFNKSAAAGNALVINNDGLFVSTADKINTVGSANGQVGVFNSAGQLTGGVMNASIVTADYLASDSEVNASITSIFS